MSSLTYMTTLFRRTILLYMLSLEFMVTLARVLTNFWVRHYPAAPYIVDKNDSSATAVCIWWCWCFPVGSGRCRGQDQSQRGRPRQQEACQTGPLHVSN